MTVVTPTILCDGTALPQDARLLSLDVMTEVGRVPRARLLFADGDVATQSFPLLDSGRITPGTQIEVQLAAGTDPAETLFTGVIFRLGLEAAARRLTVEARDPVYPLTQGRRARVFADLSDADAIRQILDEAGLTPGDLTQTAPVHERLVQSGATDWDFIVTRADANGLAVAVTDGVLSLVPILPEGDAVRTLTFGADIVDAAFELDAGRQHPQIAARAWLPADRTATEPTPAEEVAPAQGAAEPGTLGSALGLGPETLAQITPLPVDEVQAWADGRMRRTRLAMIRGRVTAQAVTDVPPMALVTLAGLGDAFDGDALVTGVRQLFTARSDWRTELQIGLPPVPFHTEPDIAAPRAAGLLPPVSGLQLGIVDAFEDDPEFRVKVLVPAFGASGEAAVWARLAQPDAGDGHGVVFVPEPGDEVVVGFLNDDPRAPVILGALASAGRPPPAPFDTRSADNIHKGIVSKLGAQITVADDGDPVLTAATPKAQIVLDDDAETLTLSDSHGNALTMDSAGITLSSAGDLTVEATSGTVTLSGSAVDVA